jgi:hypothetical protein
MEHVLPAESKTCSRCARRLPLDHFRRRRRDGDARDSYCRTCHAEAMRRYRENRRLRKMLDFARAAKWRTDRQFLNRVAAELVSSFGGVENLATEYVAHFHRIKGDPARARESTDLILAVVRLARCLEEVAR